MMSTNRSTDVVAGSASSPTKEEADESQCSNNEDEDLIQRQLNQLGQHFADWDSKTFKRVVSAYAKQTLNSKKGQIGLFISALSTVGSAGLNMWYLSSTAAGLQRDKSEDYNLTEWIVVIYEVVVVCVFIAAMALFHFCRLLLRCCNITNAAEVNDVMLFTTYLKHVGSFSAFQLLKMFTIGNLKRTIFLMLSVCNTMMASIKDKMCSAGIDFRSLVVADAAALWPLVMYLGFMCGCCPWFAPLYALFSVAWTGLYCVAGPAALLLKIRQISFVMTLHIRYWDRSDYFSFLGFANNVVGLSASEEIQIGSYMRMLGMNVDPKQSDHDEKHDDETEKETKDNEEKYDDEKAEEEPKDEEEEETDKENGYARAQSIEALGFETGKAITKSIKEFRGLNLKDLIVSALLDEGMSVFKVWLIINAWSGDPEQYINLLAHVEATNDTTNANDGQTNETQIESQLAAHMDSAKSDMAETQTVDVVGGANSEDMV